MKISEEHELADIKKKLQNKDKEIKLLDNIISEIENNEALEQVNNDL